MSMVVIDTNLFMKDYKVIESVTEDIIVPLTVIIELENHKNDFGATGYNARKSLRLLSEAIDNNYAIKENKLIVDIADYSDFEKNDDKIIQSAINHKCTLATNDVAMKVIAEATKHLKVVDLCKDTEILNPGKVEKIKVSSEVLAELFQEGKVQSIKVAHNNTFENACLLLTSGSESALVRVIDSEYHKIKEYNNVFGRINARNLEQRFLINMLFDSEIKIILVDGCAGVGKSLLSLAVACQLRAQKKYEDIVCTKSVEDIGDKIGYRPGEESDKLQPYYEAFQDNLEYLAGSELDNGKLSKQIPEVTYQHVGYMRGRTFRNSFMINDECQNHSAVTLKSILTRAGENCKVVCLGDLDQIDSKESKYTNGLFHAQRTLIGHKNVGVLTLSKSERSDICKICSKL